MNLRCTACDSRSRTTHLSSRIDLRLPRVLALTKDRRCEKLVTILAADKIGSLQEDGSSVAPGQSLPLCFCSECAVNGSGNSHANGNGSNDWTPDSWRSRPIKQCPEYPDEAALRRATGELSRLPPLVHAAEVERLKRSLRDVARGEAFLLQGGDCAELFDYCRADVIESKIKLLLQMSLVLVWGANRRLVRVARMAGQYAKPRSSPTEVVTLPGGEQREVPSFRGDILNGFRLEDRELDPQRLVK